MKQSQNINKLFYVVIGLAVIFGIWFAYNLYIYARRMADASETNRQTEIINGIFNFEDEAVLTARYIMGNYEIIAHISIPGTAINYAVVHGVDNEFYLYHDLLRQPNLNGSIFLDYLNNPCFTDRNTIVYGHNRSNGTMFHDLMLFQDEEFFKENDIIIITMINDVLQYEVFAVFTTHINFNYIIVDFADDYEFLKLVHEMKDRAMRLRNTAITANDKILILSTCTGLGPTGRLVVVGRLKWRLCEKIS